MTQFDQKDQIVTGVQQNAGRDINNIFPQAAWVPPVMLPPRAQSFVGRKEDVAWLLQQLMSEEGMTLALCGPGGMGKTALAAEALTRLVDQEDWLTRFPGGIFYHSFYAFPSLDGAFEELARLCEEDPGSDPRRAAMRALSRRRTLLVFDGVEVLEDVLPLRELGGKHVVLLLSRRQSDAPDPNHRRTLDLLSQDQAIALLQDLAGSRAADSLCVKQLVTYIGGYPLALQLIGSYLFSRQEEVTDYLQWFEQEGLAAIDFGKHQAQSIPIVLQRTYDTLTSSEQQVFALLGLLAPAAFPLQLVQNVLELREQTVRQALGSLVNLSVLCRPEQGYEVSHPLVHTFAKERFVSQKNAISSDGSNIITIWRERLLEALVSHFDQSDPYDRISLVLWHPHVFPLLSADHLTAEQCRRAAHLFNSVGFDALTQGKYAEAELLYQRALEIRGQHLEDTHPDIANSLNNLAVLYREQGKYAEAEPLYERALEIREQHLGATHPDTAQILSNLALLYHAQGRYAEAEPLLIRALEVSEQQLGITHPAMALSLNNLAALYETQGKYAKAEPLYQRALEIREQQLGATHPDTAQSLNNFAVLNHMQGKYAEAEPLYERALEIREQHLGATHPDTAQILSNLALLYHVQGRYAEAEPLLMRALEISEQQLGGTHPTTALKLNNLAELYREQGKYAEAEPLYERALVISEQQLGAMHPDTASSLNNLALLYQAQGKYVEAEPLYERALAIAEQQLGAIHPITASSLNNLAELYREQGKYVEAESLYQRALKIREQQLGATHPDITRSLNNLALLYQEQNKYAEAELLYERALAIAEQQLGAIHPITMGSLNNLASLYHRQGNYTKAEPLYERALAIAEQQLGAIHPTTALSLNNLAGLYESQGKYVEAKPLYESALSIYNQQFGAIHPSTQVVYKNYVTLLQVLENGVN